MIEVIQRNARAKRSKKDTLKLSDNKLIPKQQGGLGRRNIKLVWEGSNSINLTQQNQSTTIPLVSK